ncbi:MAG: cell division protein FtsW [Anaerolineales bacterium]|nr:MAG: cell division protein FtsW [Anaerolineales bacterium]
MIRTSNRPTYRTTRTRAIKSVRLGIDVPLLLATFTLVIFGLLMVFSASWDFSFLVYDSHTYMFTQQVKWLCVGVVISLVTAWMDYHYWRRLVVPAMLVTLAGLAAVFLANEVRYGAARTLSEGSYMPSEAAKIVTIIYLSVWLYSKRNLIKDIKFGLVPLGGIIGLVTGLILAQPDISAAATIMFLGGMLFFLAGGELKQIFVLLMIAVMLGWLIVQIQPTAKQRVADYVEGIKNPTNASDHVRRAIESVVEGGLFGVGIGNADTKLTSLPVPPTDSIFAVIAEETGLVGTTFLISLYGVVIWRGIYIARKAPDMLGSLLAGGLTFWIALEAFINMAMLVSLLPVAGNALPFISAGGSSLVVTLTSIGILMNISRLSKKQVNLKERTTYAPDSFRRGDRRRDQSSTRRTPGSW